MIAFEGWVVELLGGGGRKVRLSNDHIVTARSARTGPSSRSASLGERVQVQMLPGDFAGWRLAPA